MFAILVHFALSIDKNYLYGWKQAIETYFFVRNVCYNKNHLSISCD